MEKYSIIESKLKCIFIINNSKHFYIIEIVQKTAKM